MASSICPGAPSEQYVVAVRWCLEAGIIAPGAALQRFRPLDVRRRFHADWHQADVRRSDLPMVGSSGSLEQLNWRVASRPVNSVRCRIGFFETMLREPSRINPRSAHRPSSARWACGWQSSDGLPHLKAEVALLSGRVAQASHLPDSCRIGSVYCAECELPFDFDGKYVSRSSSGSLGSLSVIFFAKMWKCLSLLGDLQAMAHFLDRQRGPRSC